MRRDTRRRADIALEPVHVPARPRKAGRVLWIPALPAGKPRVHGFETLPGSLVCVADDALLQGCALEPAPCIFPFEPAHRMTGDRGTELWIPPPG